ncbi:MAG: hypothetical protein KKC46_08575 [Proteobacteria bacterium]|nr:hypothetical protein [Pseudomonadota bacterium]
MQINDPYETTGKLFFLNLTNGRHALIGLSFEDYAELLTRGFGDEEVYVTIKKAIFGIEYAQHVPTYKMRADLCTIRMDGQPKYQLLIDNAGIEELSTRGFVDDEKVSLIIEVSPSRRPATPLDPSNIKLDF